MWLNPVYFLCDRWLGGRKGKDGPCAPTSQANEKSVAAHGGDLGSWGVCYIYMLVL